jgi:hypothetical protein
VIGDWRLDCSRETFERCRADDKFPFMVALARAVNAMNFVHSAMIHVGEADTPEAIRGRMNSYLFASAIMYEALKLIRAMNKTFEDDKFFQDTLRSILRDPVAQKIERMHLDAARNHAVFHFLPEKFAEIINTATVDTCTFLIGQGPTRQHVYYLFADTVAAEIVVGYAANTEEFYDTLGAAMAGTRELVSRFADHAEELIGRQTQAWGFQFKDSSPSTPELP